MKKYLPIYLAIVIGSFFGNLIFKNYKTEEVMVSDNNVYMLQYGGYTNEISLNESIKKIKNYNYYTVLINNVYYVYLGITTNYDIALQIQEYYDQNNIYLYIKENYLGNTELINKIKEIDNLILEEENPNLINYINKGLSLYRDKSL